MQWCSRCKHANCERQTSHGNCAAAHQIVRALQKGPPALYCFPKKQSARWNELLPDKMKKSEALLCWDHRWPPPGLPLFGAWSPCPSGPVAGARAAHLRLGGRSLSHAPVAGAARPLHQSSCYAASPRCLEPLPRLSAPSTNPPCHSASSTKPPPRSSRCLSPFSVCRLFCCVSFHCTIVDACAPYNRD
jgi:hypothetical protein